ncbi:M48 family metallopeptidase [Pyrococcus yayanosii]|uniref:Predicted zinc-dependent protease n=1 Tax=Pyrococcus yayanosii (strain CH1 / JCM 16557) TaxID=529709 RepID=F8AIV7_PYRYC|nr:SprT family zinc-dependent metalloprotease [Pyrococcus yayanosii]AEH24432.1 Predicted zinc-dependent protease [Pyrococcus yayanosii CH1]
MRLRIGDVEVEYEVVLRPTRYVTIRVNPNGSLTVVSPVEGVDEILKRKARWIRRQLAVVEEGKRLASQGFPLFGRFYKPVRCERTGVEGESLCYSSLRALENFIRNSLKERIGEIVEDVSGVLGVRPRKVFIRVMRTRWGSCSGRGNVAINLAAAALPFDLLHYLVTHEVAHLISPRHDGEFWSAVAKLHPDYREKRGVLKVWWVVVHVHELWREVLG